MTTRERSLKKTSAVLVLVAVFCLSSLGAMSVFGQTETGQVTAKVSDPSGAVVAGAKISLKSLSTGATRTGTTTGEGLAVVTNLLPGLYEITATAAGFGSSTARVEITPGAKTEVPMTLSAAGAQETVNVVAAQGGVEVNTQSQELSDVISAKQITELPSLTRNPYDFTVVSGNVSGDPSGSTGHGVGASINGQRSSSTSILLDGAENQDYFGALVGQSVPLDSVQEFRLITNDFTAEYGRATGGIVNLTTKAGGNQFHGTLFEYNRISALSSNDFNNNANAVARGVFTRNQFGYSVGGRVIKDKLFFFSSTEWTRIRSSQGTIVVVPTAELLAQTPANVQAFFAPYKLTTPINGRVFTAGELGIAGVPAGLPAFGQVNYSVPTDAGGGTPQNSYSTVNRIDFNISDKTLLYGRYALQSQSFLFGSVSTSPYDGFGTGSTTFSQNYLVSLTHTFTPNLVADAKVVYNRLNSVLPFGAQPPNIPTLYLTTSGGAIGNFPTAFPGYNEFTPGASNVGFGGPQNLFQTFGDVSWNRGKHNFRFGGQFLYIQDNRQFDAYEEAVEALGGNNAQGFSNLLKGQLVLFETAVNPQGKFPGQQVQLPVQAPSFVRSNRYKDYALYAQDSWHLSSRITLNLGVRYEYYGVQRNKDPNLESNFFFGAGNNIFEKIRNGAVQTTPNSPVGGVWKSSPHNFAPRLGFAWDVFGDGKTSVRGGYGIAYERNFGNVTFNIIQNPPNYAVIALQGQGISPVTIDNEGPLAGSSGTKTLPGTSLRAIDPNIKTAYAHLYSVAVERQLTRNTVASIEYSGSTGVNLYDISNINRHGTGLVYLGSLAHNPFTMAPSDRLNGQYTNINFRSSNGSSRYNAVIFGINSSGFGKTGLQFTANYRYSVSRDDLSDTFSGGSNAGGGPVLGYVDPFNPKLDYGYSDFDIRHRFGASAIWNIPFAKETKGLVRQIADGWQLTGIFSAHTGLPFTMFDCQDLVSACHRLIPGGSVNTSRHLVPDATQGNNFYNYIDLSASNPQSFQNPASHNGEVGPFPSNMVPRNLFRGPGAWNLDFGTYKNFRVSEGKSIQFRSEFYNVFNHANLFTFSPFTGGIGSAGEIQTLPYVPAFFRGNRNVQMALKFIF
jgi:outer membrane receptor protein involved in Fe transport